MQELLKAIQVITEFLDSCKDVSNGEIITQDGVHLRTDWGYFEDGLTELRTYARGKHDG